MFSYRHAFHAGNHGDVLKHMVLIATLRHLMLKPGTLTMVDTHAGAGLYRLDSDFTDKGGEATHGVVRLFEVLRPAAGQAPESTPVLDDYLDLVAGFNPDGALRVYPGSPFVMQHLMRHDARDRLKLFELHPTDGKSLSSNVAQLEAGRSVVVVRQDGFEGLKPLLPPPADAQGSRRALVLMDPSYELKSDYGKVSACIQDAVKRFATGTYVVWYPVIPRTEAHDLPRKLRGLAQRAGRGWLNATLAIGHPPLAPNERPGLTASGMFVINPPHTLAEGLKASLPRLVDILGRGRGQGHTLEHGSA
ncbi:MAG: 23S rRNA (adenine(2030)-N(6))-methyltransferase RlmJ [Hydrogenophaga sp.]|uniref:23S rRNA (adenine(2030)-N(6))-methyltransferase RlmJ n=1 Tax=Hydrogenophaga sp. TaxID=1904254 RepID=UPI001E0B7C24|nr:23S rRNA (adenine(2030)-N(6))-methyltransferase RlmJ [Hydrogenophaga sp.]MBX3611178.1 23S rRNA (adenine(2030)-N(6))-methyltransferase RlmJ [Hydrogenophaga sp.]